MKLPCTHSNARKERGAMGSTNDYVCDGCGDSFTSRESLESAQAHAEKQVAEIKAKQVFAATTYARNGNIYLWNQLDATSVDEAKDEALKRFPVKGATLLAVGEKSQSGDAIAGYLQLFEYDYMTQWTQLRSR